MAYDMSCIIDKKIHTTIPIGTVSFLNQLLGSEMVDSLNLSDNYLEGFVSCSHFIRLLSDPPQLLTEDTAKSAFRRGAAIITSRNLVGIQIEIPVAFCKSEDIRLRGKWMNLLDRRYRCERNDSEAIDHELDKLTVFSFISVSVKNVPDLFKSSKIEAFNALDPLKVKTTSDGTKIPCTRGVTFLLKDSFNLQILFSPNSRRNRIYEFRKYPAHEEEYSSFISSSSSFLCKRVVIEGFSEETFSHWNSHVFIMSDLNDCFRQLRAFDSDTEINRFRKTISNGPYIAPVTYS